ncbi:MAG: uL15 family ribosomal protein [Candidatus Liptonbacteria bacterium]
MQLHQLKKTKKSKAPRIGRSGKRGSYSGRGIKGQKSRAGHRIRPALRDLIIRLPKKRGFRNKPTTEKAFVLNISDLSALKAKLDRVAVLNTETLKVLKVLPMRWKGPVKILGNGDLDFVVTLKGLGVSASAKAKIEKAGGRVIANNANESVK